MPKLPRLPAREIRRALEHVGFHLARQRGSHLIMTNSATGLVAVVPDYGARKVPVGTLRGILRQAGLTPQEFIDLLD